MAQVRIDKIIIHCSDSPQGRGDDAETIHHWHLSRGWNGVGYNWIILEDGTLQAGRPEYWTGSHCKGHNIYSIGICLIGDDEFTDDQYDTLSMVIRARLNRYPNAKVYGHYQLDGGKTCPNFDVPRWLEGEGISQQFPHIAGPS